jgi:hypothetical protein
MTDRPTPVSDPKPAPSEKPPRMPPPWFVRAAWAFHRGYYRLTGGRRGLRLPQAGKVRGRAAQGEERDRLWARWSEFGNDDLDAYARLRSTETAVVVLEPREG